MIWLYPITAFCWGAYAGRQQVRQTPHSSPCRVAFVVAGNVLLCPLMILVAAWRTA